MKVIATYTFEFYPDTSDLDDTVIDKKGLAEDLTEKELQYMINDGEITAKDFDYKVVDDHNDHKIPNYPIYMLKEDAYKNFNPNICFKY